MSASWSMLPLLRCLALTAVLIAAGACGDGVGNETEDSPVPADIGGTADTAPDGAVIADTAGDAALPDTAPDVPDVADAAPVDTVPVADAPTEEVAPPDAGEETAQDDAGDDLALPDVQEVDAVPTVDVAPTVDVGTVDAGAPGTDVTTAPACSTAADCTAELSACQVATCVGGVCGTATLLDGATCNDGAACTLQDTCKAGLCVGLDPFGLSSWPGPATAAMASGLVPWGDGWLLAGDAVATDATTTDAWVLAVDRFGTNLWTKTYGGAGNETIADIQALGDSGFLLAGRTAPANGAPVNGNGTTTAKGDGWLVRVDAFGVPMWTATVGGAENDELEDVLALPNGTFVVAGRTRSSGQGKHDAWLVAVSAAGQVLWQATYGGVLDDVATAVTALPGDAGFLVAGATIPAGSTHEDVWLAHVDAQGALVWQKNWGGFGADRAVDVAALADGGILVLGQTDAKGAGKHDFWLLRTDAEGTLVWDKTYGGSETEKPSDLLVMADGGLLLAGYTSTYGNGKASAWLVRTDAVGNLHWTEAYGGKEADKVQAVAEHADGRIGAAGSTFDAVAKHDRAMLIRVDLWGIDSCKDQGQCATMTLESCSDGAPCTMDGCTAAKGCGHAAAPDGMLCGTTKVCLKGACM